MSAPPCKPFALLLYSYIEWLVYFLSSLYGSKVTFQQCLCLPFPVPWALNPVPGELRGQMFILTLLVNGQLRQKGTDNSPDLLSWVFNWILTSSELKPVEPVALQVQDWEPMLQSLLYQDFISVFSGLRLVFIVYRLLFKLFCKWLFSM